MRPLLLATAITLVFSVAGRASADETLQEWDFADAADTLGWTAAEPVDELAPKDGALSVVAKAGYRPKLESPLFQIPAQAWQRVEIDMKTDADGNCLMYYSNTTEEPYHGFRPGQYAQFPVRGDGQYHTYTIHPFWQKQGKMVHVRFDPPGDHISIRSIRILSPGVGVAVRRESGVPLVAWWSTTPTLVSSSDGSGGLKITGTRDGTLMSPPLDFDTDLNTVVSVLMVSDKPGTAMLRWASDGADGLQQIPLPLYGDGKTHNYAIDLTDTAEWTGRIVALGVTPTDSTEKRTVLLKSIDVGDKPVGPAEIRIVKFGLEGTFSRAGQTAKLVAEVKNTGGSPAQGVEALPSVQGIGITNIMLSGRIPDLLPGETRRFTWDLTADREGTFRAECAAQGSNAPRVRAHTAVRFYPALDKSQVRNLKYVPEPKPADTGGYLVGAYYFPGWHTYERWAVLDDFPERKPVLGYYREGNPEVVDWQINWALAHGISYFIYDWYWSAGGRQLEQGLHDAYLKSRYQDRLKFCLLWANHNPAGTSSEQDLVNVTNYWIENYFKLPNYLKIDGKNVMVIFSPHRLTEDMGADGVKAGFAKIRKMCEDSGAGGLYLVACAYPNTSVVKQLEYEGYDAISGYNYPPAGNKGQQFAPYEWMVDGYQEFWDAIDKDATVPYIPVCEPGWDSRPWHGLKSYVRTGKTPQLWQKMLTNAKRFVDRPDYQAPPGGKKLVFLEAWNEFGEGDYIEPHAEFGFDHLEAVRQVFASKSEKPTIIVPQDIGMGPYDIAKPQPRTVWDFTNKDDRNWHIGNMKEFFYKNGAMTAVAQNHDPAFYSPLTDVDASKFKVLEIKMKVDKGAEAQVFFSRPRGQMSEERSARFGIIADNEWHVYTVDLSSNPRWRGRVGQFRLDPTDTAEANVEVAYFRLR